MTITEVLCIRLWDNDAQHRHFERVYFGKSKQFNETWYESCREILSPLGGVYLVVTSEWFSNPAYLGADDFSHMLAFGPKCFPDACDFGYESTAEGVILAVSYVK